MHATCHHPTPRDVASILYARRGLFKPVEASMSRLWYEVCLLCEQHLRDLFRSLTVGRE